MATPDLTYADHGLFTAFYPQTADGRAAWDNLALGTEGTGKVLSIHAATIIAQLRRVGYRVAKSKPITMSDDALLSALGV